MCKTETIAKSILISKNWSNWLGFVSFLEVLKNIYIVSKLKLEYILIYLNCTQENWLVIQLEIRIMKVFHIDKTEGFLG